MPYTITQEPTFLRIILRGAVTLSELHALADALAAVDQSSAVAPNRLIDLSAVVEPHLTYASVRTFVERRKEAPSDTGVKMAVMASRPIHVGLARMFQNLNDQPQITVEIFATVEAAETWLRAE